MDLPASAAGKVTAVHLKEGGTASVGDLIVTVESLDAVSVPADDVVRKEPKLEEPVLESSKEAEVETVDVATATSENIAVNVPDLGDVSDVDIIEVSVQVGDTVEKEQTLAVLETQQVPILHQGFQPLRLNPPPTQCRPLLNVPL
jgi:pyruvate dehydrogenase E2 component (dihydrolipoamide acetyltransferase)